MTTIRQVVGYEYSAVRLMMIVNIWWLGIRAYGGVLKSARVMRELLDRHRRLLGKAKLVRAVKIGPLYYWDIFNPGWPSKAFNSFFTNQLHEVKPISANHTSLRRLLIAITKKCPLSCEHCSEGATLNHNDVLTYEDLAERLDSYVQRGVGQLVYSGGEPLHRYQDLLKLLERFRRDCDQWIYTSGYGLTLEKAHQLKAAGLNGAAISLDHHKEDEHNRFRRNGKSYGWVIEAVANCRAAGILPAFNMVPTRSYLDGNDMEDYLELARSLHVPIVNIIEPRAVGHYEGKDVALTGPQKESLLRLSNRFNFDKSLLPYPTVIYPAAFRAAWPCGGGRSYLFLDYDGVAYPCPFCRVPVKDVSLKESACAAP